MDAVRIALQVSVIFAAEAVWLILAHHVGIHGAAKYGGMAAVAWLGAALGEAAL
jgi:hypothetical protein